MLESQGAKIDEMHAVVKKREDRQDAAMALKLTNMSAMERVEYDRNLAAVQTKKQEDAEAKAAKEVAKAAKVAEKAEAKTAKEAAKIQRDAAKAFATERKKLEAETTRALKAMANQ